MEGFRVLKTLHTCSCPGSLILSRSVQGYLPPECWCLLHSPAQFSGGDVLLTCLDESLFSTFLWGSPCEFCQQAGPLATDQRQCSYYYDRTQDSSKKILMVTFLNKVGTNSAHSLFDVGVNMRTISIFYLSWQSLSSLITPLKGE